MPSVGHKEESVRARGLGAILGVAWPVCAQHHSASFFRGFLSVYLSVSTMSFRRTLIIGLRTPKIIQEDFMVKTLTLITSANTLLPKKVIGWSSGWIRMFNPSQMTRNNSECPEEQRIVGNVPSPKSNGNFESYNFQQHKDCKTL